jgi:GT2 family glycosyltransferase
MPVHGSWEVARRAAAALLGQLGPDREAILVDDASADPPPSDFPLRVRARNERAVGFGPTCNLGARLAAGRFLLFLNSDSVVEPGAVEALEQRAELKREAVTGLLLNEDGSLQEAGSSIGRDGVTFPLGAGAEPDDPVWAFRREVDFGSAACLLVEREAFAAANGFDDAFAPGYYEDADLCLRLAERGISTVVEPRCRVVHLQYGSGSRARAEQLVRRNRTTFMVRWGSRFGHRPVVGAARPWPHRLLALRDGIALTRFLVFGEKRLAAETARDRPGCRVTLVGAGAADGVEQASPPDLASWLEARRFHYTAVLGAPAEITDALRRSQPQAVQSLDDPTLPPPGAEPRG